MSLALSEHLPLIASAPDGIQKLRGLILELAVRGKLVPQDLNDEPASELLKRIAQNRTKLDVVTARKRSRQTPPSENVSWPFAIPDNWKWSCLSDLTQVLNGRAYSKDELLDSGTPVLRVGNLFTSNHWYYSDLALEPGKYCDKGDLIYSWSASFGPFIWNGPKVIYHYHIWKLSLFDEESYSKEFLYKFLLEKTAEIKASSHGVSMVHMTKEKMENLSVPVPPLAEQHRIVAKVDELMSLCDRLESEQNDSAAAHTQLVKTLLCTLSQSTSAADFEANWQRIAEHFETLFTTEASIGALQKTILQLAVRGKLVPQDSNDEPASELLKRIQRDRAQKADAGIFKRSKTTSLHTNEQPCDVPNGWASVRLSDCGEFRGGKTPSTSRSEYWGGTIPWVSPKDMKTLVISKTEDSVTDLAISNGLSLIPESSVLIVVRSGILRRSVPVGINSLQCTVNQDLKALCLIIPDMAQYIQLLIRGFEQLILKTLTKVGTTVESIKFEEFSRQIFPLPPLAEQRRIVAKVDELMAVCDQLKASIKVATAAQSTLSSALIQKALEAA